MMAEIGNIFSGSQVTIEWFADDHLKHRSTNWH